MKTRKSIAHIIILLVLIVSVSAFIVYHLIKNQSYVVQAQTTSFVAREGTKLMLDGQEFKFIGVNREGLASSLFFRFPNGVPIGNTQPELDAFLDNTFTKLKENNINVVRFWAFQSYVDNNGTIDFFPIDNVINRAKAKGIKLIPVLENHFHWSTQDWLKSGGNKDSTWYKDGYKILNGSYTLSYRDYVQQIVSRYKDEPTVLMWQLMSEATLEQNPTYPTALYDFTSDMSHLVKTIDANHLVSIGVSGTGQPGTEGTDYKNLHSIADIDIVGAHDYNYPEEPLPGSPESPRSQVDFELYVQDSKTPTPQWYSIIHRQITLGKWVTLYGNIPSTIGSLPITKAAINIKVNGMDAWTGPIYFDNITLGDTTYEFENGLQGWTREGSSSDSPLKISNTTADNSLSSLEVDINNNRTSNTRLFPVTLPANLPGSQFKIRVYVPSDAPSLSKNTMYSDLMDAKSLDKPFFFGEVGINKYRPGESNPSLLCINPDCYAADQRANLYNAKVRAAFANGASGYIVWYWDNSSVANTKLGTSCSYFGPYCFDDQDPLVAMLKNYWHEINIIPPTPTPEPSPSPTSTPEPSPSPSPEPSPAPSPNPSPSPEPTPIPSPTSEPSSNTGNTDGGGSSSGSSGSSSNSGTSGNSSSVPSVLSARTGRGGDLNGDGHVNIFDLSSLLSGWGRQAGFAGGDINGDGIVNVIDLSILLSSWGT